jgi:hypothetical protein
MMPIEPTERLNEGRTRLNGILSLSKDVP